ncbi:MAG TPA: DUF1800 family protein, partial [Gemmatimonadaceae bacterium]|nr:DUF1800 family protein [Gemmatimonadaceae bacterium]
MTKDRYPTMRTLASIFAALVVLTAAAHGQQAPASPQSRELLPDEQVQQVLNRLAFGARPGDADKVRAMGVDRWIDQQLHPERISDPPGDALTSKYAVFDMKTQDIVRDYTQLQQLQRQVKKEDAGDSSAMVKADQRDARAEALAKNPQLAVAARKAQQLVGEVQSSELARAVASDRQLDEVMVGFWENHFSVFSGKGQTRLYLASYDRDVIRPNALGKFRDLLGAVAKSPAMLFFLDNWQSAADSTEPTLGNRGRGRPG